MTNPKSEENALPDANEGIFLTVGTEVSMVRKCGFSCVQPYFIAYGGKGQTASKICYDGSIGEFSVLVNWNLEESVPYSLWAEDEVLPSGWVPLSYLSVEKTDVYGPWRGKDLNDELLAFQGKLVNMAGDGMSLQKKVAAQVRKRRYAELCTAKKKLLNNAMVLANNVATEVSTLMWSETGLQGVESKKYKMLMKNINTSIRRLNCHMYVANQVGLHDKHPVLMSVAEDIHKFLHSVATDSLWLGLVWEDEDEDEDDADEGHNPCEFYYNIGEAISATAKERTAFDEEMRFENSWLEFSGSH